jgi:hypothetical protein
VSKKHTETPDPKPGPPEPVRQNKSIIQPIMDDLKGQTILPAEDEVGAPDPAGPGDPPQPAELDQDPGGGYNPDGTYPQT